MIVDGLDLDLSGYQLLPGLINAHDHLEFALFPRLGNGTYPNAAEWARDIYHPDDSPIADHLRVPKDVRLRWGGLRNLLAGVTTVCHHNPYHPVFDDRFPVRVLKRFGWAHSLAFEDDLAGCFAETPEDWPFIIHAGEGTDEASAREIFQLRESGVLAERTILVHAVAFDAEGWQLVAKSGASVVWCPRSNHFTLGRTICRPMLESGVCFALATDSAITAEGDLLDELRFAHDRYGVTWQRLLSMVTTNATRALRCDPAPDDWIAVREFGEQPALVVIGGRIRLISCDLAKRCAPHLGTEMSILHVEGRSPVFVDADITSLLRAAREALGSDDVRLAGRRILQ